MKSNTPQPAQAPQTPPSGLTQPQFQETPPTPSTPPPTIPAPMDPLAKSKAEALARPFKAYAIVPLGHSDLHLLVEVEVKGDSAKIVRKAEPNAREVCVGRAIACLDGTDGFGYGPTE